MPLRLVGYDRIRADLDEQLLYAEGDFRALAGSRIFMTGGTGFVGRWLLESLLHANKRLNLAVKLALLSRTPDEFSTNFPHLVANHNVELIAGDIRDIPPRIGTFDGCIHAATPASAKLNREDPLEMLDTIVDGGRAVLEIVARAGAIPFLLTSTGAVYGPSGTSASAETVMSGPDPLLAGSAYAEGKRITELQCAIYTRTHKIQAKIARLFAFIGPYLPLDQHFAVGNFIADVLAERPIVITGTGTAVRSYLYAADMATWLWAIFVRGNVLRPYNVGHSEAIAASNLAQRIAQYATAPAVAEIQGNRTHALAAEYYVPDTRRIRTELGVRELVSIHEGISRTLDYHRGNPIPAA